MVAIPNKMESEWVFIKSEDNNPDEAVKKGAEESVESGILASKTDIEDIQVIEQSFKNKVVTSLSSKVKPCAQIALITAKVAARFSLALGVSSYASPMVIGFTARTFLPDDKISVIWSDRGNFYKATVVAGMGLASFYILPLPAVAALAGGAIGQGMIGNNENMKWELNPAKVEPGQAKSMNENAKEIAQFASRFMLGLAMVASTQAAAAGFVVTMAISNDAMSDYLQEMSQKSTMAATAAMTVGGIAMFYYLQAASFSMLAGAMVSKSLCDDYLHI